MRYRYQNAQNLKDRAKGFLGGNYVVCIEAVLVLEAVRFILLSGLGLLDRSLMAAIPALQSGTGYVISSIFYWVVSIGLGAFINMMMAGMALICLKISSGQVPAIADLLEGYRTRPERTFLISLGISIPQNLALLPMNLFLEFYFREQSSRLLWGLGISAVLGTAVAIFFSLSLCLGFFLMYDFPNLTASETLREIWKRMKGHKTRLLLLELSFIPMMILALLSFGVGYLWVYPFMQETIALFYLDMMNPQPVAEQWERTV